MFPVNVEALIKAYRDEGLTLAQCGRRFGIGAQTVCDYLVRAGVPRRPRGVPAKPRQWYTCENCNRRFTPKRTGRRQRFCSKTCGYIGVRQLRTKGSRGYRLRHVWGHPWKYIGQVLECSATSAQLNAKAYAKSRKLPWPIDLMGRRSRADIHRQDK